MPHNAFLYDLGKRWAEETASTTRVFSADPYTVCVIEYGAGVIGVAKRNPLDAPNYKLGEEIATRRAFITLGRASIELGRAAYRAKLDQQSTAS